MKKLISMLLALTLVLAIVPTAFAAGTFEYTLNATASGSLLTLPQTGYTNYNSAADTVEIWPGQGGKGNTANDIARHNVSGSYEQNFTLPSVFPAAGKTIVFSFKFMREHDSVTNIRPMFENINRYEYAQGFDIDKEGNVKLIQGGDVLANVGSYEYHDIKMVYTTYADQNMVSEFYIDGKKFGPYTDTGAFTAANSMTALRILTTGDSRVGRVIGSTRADSRPERIFFKNFVATDDLSILPKGVQLISVKNVSDNEILFTANQDITAPVIDDVYIEGLTVTKVEPKASNTFLVTVEDDGHACTKATHQSYEVGETYSYDVYIGDDNFTGSFVEKHMGSVDYYDNDNFPTWVANTALPGGNKMSTQWGITDGKNGYEGDTAFAWTPYQGATAASEITYNKYLGSFNWFSTKYGWNNGTGTINNDKFVVSVDFMRGSDRVGGYPLALGSGQWSTTDIVFGAILDQATGSLKIGPTTIDSNVGVKVWHNLTYHITLSSRGSCATVYYDGVNKGDFNMGYTAGIYTIRSWMGSVQPTDATIAALNCQDPARFDVLAFDNFYIGRDFGYKTSDIVLTEKWDGSAANIYTGALNRKNPIVSALYDSEGAIKDVQVGTVWKNAFMGTSFPGALTYDSAVAGDTIKVFVVNDLLNIRPISNVLTKTVQ